MAEKAAPSPLARTVLQQCVGARLQVEPAGESSEGRWVEIHRGMVIYVCFFKGATEEILPKMVSALLSLRACESDSGRLVSVLDLPGSILLVPQATLGGKTKGCGMQYHGNIGKEDGLRLYSHLVTLCREGLRDGAAAGSGAGPERDGARVMVQHGTYGNRQVLKLDTNGPHTHLLEF